MTYEEVKEKLGNRSSRRMPGRSTYLVARQNGIIALCYHSTDVVVWWPCGRMMLHSGGHRTRTTKERISEYSGLNIFQRRYLWTVRARYYTGGAILGLNFIDGMSLRGDILLME